MLHVAADPSGCGEVTAVSVVPNADCIAAIVPLTFSRRDARWDLGHGQPVRAEDLGDELCVGRVGAVAVAELASC